ncbi:hypothetical protein [Microvirga yunnanensis]|uniref:hypothetical protein n=1 Tax=Microvirga yunnanensis TaxID=2953740 RepID=UPI0021C8BCD3|nr:hypothetical protein [Microvirga sp. HBU65207]
MTKPVLEFLKNEAGEEEGLGDAGIETFRDAPYASCAREAGQNSRDAAEKLPVRMTFNLFQVPHSDFPCYDRLRDTLIACAAAAEQEKDAEFFTNACAVMNSPQIPVLAIADYNTKGLTGPSDRLGTPFHSLLKATGVSTKESPTSGGSFGIGKNASFAVSDLQTVFYSTVYEDPDSAEGIFAAQGKVKLVSHTDAGGVPRRATGYWGNPDKFRAVTDGTLVPAWMSRTETGTSIFCMGFRETDDWAERMTYSLVSNFFCAVHREEMIFEVASGKIHINRNTLEGLLSREDIRAAADRSGHLSDLEFAEQLYRCLVSANADEQILNISGLGQMRVRILIEEGMPRRVGFIRNGMLITDSLKHFGQALARFPGSRDFVVLVEPVDDGAGRLLKKLENPAHDGFSAQRISDPAKRGAAEAAMRKLGKQLRDLIRETTGVKHEGAVILDELGRFFAEPGKSDTPSDPDAENDPEKYTYDVPRRKRQKRQAQMPAGGHQGGRSATGSGTSGNGGGAGTATGSGSGGIGARGDREVVELRDVRNRIRRDAAGRPRSRVLHFSPEAGGSIELSVQATGVNAPEQLVLTGTDSGTLKGGAVKLEVSEGERCSVTVSFEDSYDGPIEIIAVTRETAEAGA